MTERPAVSWSRISGHYTRLLVFIPPTPVCFGARGASLQCNSLHVCGRRVGLSSGTRSADCASVKTERVEKKKDEDEQEQGRDKEHSFTQEKTRQKRLRIKKKGLLRGKKGVEFCGGEEIRVEGS